MVVCAEGRLRLQSGCPGLMERMNETFNFSLNEAYSILLEHQASDHNLDPAAEAALIVIYSALIVLGLVANLLICWVVARRPHLHSARNLYIVNLTVSDITLCLICMPFTLFSLIRRNWTLGLFLCKAVPAVQGTNIMVSIGTITVIALDRYFTIVRGQDAAGGSRNVVVSILLVWVLSFTSTLPVVYYQEVEPFKVHRLVLYEMCLEKWPSAKLKAGYAAALLLIQAVIPVTVVSAVHGAIAAHLHHHASMQRDSRRAQRELHRNRRTTLILTGVAVIFGVSWLPLGAFSLVADLVDLSQRTLYLGLAACHVLAMSSALSNPVVYGWFNSNIKAELLSLCPQAIKSRRAPPQPEEQTAYTMRTKQSINKISPPMAMRSITIADGDDVTAI